MKKRNFKIKAENESKNQESHYNNIIHKFVEDKEMFLEMSDEMENRTVPVMMRIDKYHVALLDHLADRWQSTRSALATEIIEKIIRDMFFTVYKDKSDKEQTELYRKAIDDFEKKKKGLKKKKE